MSHSDYDDEFDENADSVDANDDEPEAADDSAAAAPASDDDSSNLSDIAEAETLTVSSKESVRRQLEEEMARFLARGGKITEVPPDETADPPRKPTSSYGSKPI